VKRENELQGSEWLIPLLLYIRVVERIAVDKPFWVISKDFIPMLKHGKRRT
jgi:hypothetical protein